MELDRVSFLVHAVTSWTFPTNTRRMSIPFRSKILVRLTRDAGIEFCSFCSIGDKTVLERVQHAKKVNEEVNEKGLQASIRRQRRFDGLQLLEKTKLHR